MRIGAFTEQLYDVTRTLAALIDEAAAVEGMGFHTFWVPNIFNLDAVTVLALAGEKTDRIELGTAVVPAPNRHPVALAQQALTTQLACEGRFTLGIGMSHRMVTRDMFGLSYESPARQMREYLEILLPLLAGERVGIQGTFFSAHAGLAVPGRRDVRVIIAAMGPRMLRIAGRLADGTIPWLAGPKTLEQHILPNLRAGARAAQRPDPRAIAGLPVALTRDLDGARSVVDRLFQIYTNIPSYKDMLEREGCARPSQVALLGDEPSLRSQLRRLEDLGVTDLAATCVPTDPDAIARTQEFLAAEVD